MSYEVEVGADVMQRLRTGPMELFAAYLAVHIKIADDPWGGPSRVEGSPDNPSRERMLGQNQGWVDYIVVEWEHKVHVVNYVWFG